MNILALTTMNSIELEVILPNGKSLRSSSCTPGKINLTMRVKFLIPPVSVKYRSIYLEFIWAGIYFSPSLTIRYKQNVNGVIIEKTKVVPIKYEDVVVK